LLFFSGNSVTWTGSIEILDWFDTFQCLRKV